jgi:Cof subfamily protein (haloacid dehalogenase superfamily)
VTVRLLVLDLDGTLVTPEFEVRPRVRLAVAEALARGVRVVVATGRMYRSAVRYARLLRIHEPIICLQGAYVRTIDPLDDRGGEVLYHRPLAASVAREAIRWSRDLGLDPHLNFGDRLVMERGDEGSPDYERTVGVDAHFVPDLLAAARRRPTKVVSVGAPGVPEAVLAEGRVRFADRAQVTVSHPEYLEFTAPGVTKARALRWLARREGIAMTEIVAIGDQYNDLEMLRAAGHGVAMGTAPVPVREAAASVTGSVLEDGAALAIERLVLAGPRAA